MNQLPTSADAPRIIFLANPYSVHVDVWRKALEMCEIPLHIETAAYPQREQPPGVSIEHRPPDWLPGPHALRCLWTAVLNRFRRRKPGEIVHAHGTSASGLIAWAGRHPYIVTTYGTEVTLAHRRGPLYAWMIGRVLRGAERLTASSTEMVDVLTQKYGIARDRIQLFDLGIERDVFHPLDDDQRAALRREMGIAADEPVWVSIKRAVPWYRTVELLQAFFDYCQTHPAGRLVVLCGDSVADYARHVHNMVRASPFGDRVHLQTTWLDPPAVARWLQLADYGISIAESDQLSNSIVETMACGAIPILLDIEGYRPLKAKSAPVIWLDDYSPRHLGEAFQSTAGMSRDQQAKLSVAAQRYVDEHHSQRMVEQHLRRLYNLSPPTIVETVRAA